jgi:hypothetical protein
VFSRPPRIAVSLDGEVPMAAGSAAISAVTSAEGALRLA